ncbi:RNA-directed DNA polymerase, eukaryota [Tanacetum coccineum]
MGTMDLNTVRSCWGNSIFEYVQSDSVGYSGGILCIWDPNSFRRNSFTRSDYFVIIRGVWLKSGIDLLIVVVYAPQDAKEKHMLWEYLTHISNSWDGKIVMMGDFNEVRFKSDRFGSNFNVHEAEKFNSFIYNAGMEEVSLGGSAFTWCHRSASKMSKLDRFFVSENLLTSCPNISAITLERFISDHRPILLRETSFDYGPIPFRFYKYWLEVDGFDKMVRESWEAAPGNKDNAIRSFMGKLKFLKDRIRVWLSIHKANSRSDTDILKEELRLCDELIDKGMGSSEVVQNRLEILNKIHQVQKNQASEISQKAKIKWAIEGDENVKFFHGILNKKRSQSQIRGVMANGVWIDDPVKVKDEFLMHFRSRFDKPLLNRALLDLNFTNSLTNEQKEDLEQDITKEEVKRAVWDCGVDKSPGPDGFSFYFYRHFWSMIEDDVFGAVEYFFINGDIPNGCNSNFIALIPKIIDANMVKDFRPISLIGSLYKIIAKLLANRLVGVLSNLINEVQSAFVADRQILDGPFILNEVLQWCRKKRKHALIFKVDFEKAYDSVRWDFLDDVLDKFGFGVKWRNWIQSCLRSSRGSILINGSPTKEFQFFRGLKQGDPLSPFLFILVMESLHISFQRVVDAGLFNGINLSSTVNLSHLFYADDAIFIGQWNELNIDTLVRVLECFFRASGLRINMSKSKIMGVNVEDAKVKIAANKLGCLVLKTPFTYLGTKVGENMHRKHAWNEVVEKVLSRLSRWKLKTLSIGGRFTLLKSVLGSMPIFHMSIFKVPSSILNSLEVIRSRFFNGHEHKSNKATWFKWNKVLTSKEKGGLGVSSLFALNRGLLFKWLWRFYSQKDSLWTKVIKALYGEDGSLDKVGASAARTCWTTIVQEVKVIQAQGINIHDFIKLKLGNGEDSRFWLDKWYEGGVLKRLFPRVYALELDKNISVSSKLKAPSLVTTFRRNARSGIEQTQFDSMAEIMKTISLVPRVDRYIWSLENDGSFSVASIRKTLDDNRFQEESLSTRWVKSVPIKVNILAWKVKSNALPTRFNISRRGMDIDSIDCPICKMGVETTSHVFFQCNVVRQVMRKISSWWNVEYMEVNSYEEWRSWLVSTRIRSNIKVIIEGVYYGLWSTKEEESIREIKSDQDTVDMLTVGYDNRNEIDMYVEHFDYDIMEMIDVVIKNISTHDPFLNKLCTFRILFRGPKGVVYPAFDPNIPWDNMEPMLGMSYESPHQLKLALANCGVAHDVQVGKPRKVRTRLFRGDEGNQASKKPVKKPIKKVVKKPVKKIPDSQSGEGTSKSPKWTKKQILNSKKVPCPFRLYASWMSNEHSFQIKSLISEHKCCRNYNLVSLVTYKWIDLHYSKEIIDDPLMPLRKMKDDTRQKFMIDYRQAILDLNPRSVCRLDVNESANGFVYFKRMYICFKGVKDGWLTGCRKVIGLDGCFLKHTCKGELLTAMGRNANNQMYHITWAVVRVENAKNWGWFLHLFHDDLSLNEGNGITIILDSHNVISLHLNPNSWSRDFFEMERRCATFENGIFKSFNKAIMGLRHKPSITMWEEIRLYIMQRLVAMNKIAFSLEGRITPSIRKRDWVVFPNGGESGSRGDGSGGSGGSGGGMGSTTSRYGGNTSNVVGGGNTSRGGRSRRGSRMARTLTSDGYLTVEELDKERREEHEWEDRIDYFNPANWREDSLKEAPYNQVYQETFIPHIYSQPTQQSAVYGAGEKPDVEKTDTTADIEEAPVVETTVTTAENEETQVEKGNASAAVDKGKALTVKEKGKAPAVEDKPTPKRKRGRPPSHVDVIDIITYTLH